MLLYSCDTALFSDLEPEAIEGEREALRRLDREEATDRDMCRVIELVLRKGSVRHAKLLESNVSVTDGWV